MLYKEKLLPIFLGPVMLYYESYNKKFFSFVHIKQKIRDVEIVFGSDEEKATNTAIHNVFQKATHLLCTKHMNDNIRQNLKNTYVRYDVPGNVERKYSCNFWTKRNC